MSRMAIYFSRYLRWRSAGALDSYIPLGILVIQYDISDEDDLYMSASL